MALTREQVARTLDRLTKSVVKDACWTCDCFQGLVTQLELDAAEDVSALTGPLKAAHEDMHACLGCDPCPPGAVYADYQRCRSWRRGGG